MSALLSHEETVALLRQAKAGDAAAEEKLLVSNIALVRSIVRGFLGRGAEYDDLMQIGSIGLIKAIKGYDEAFGVRFSTYAVPMIAGEIRRFLRDDGIVKVSRSIKERAIRIYRAQDELKRRLGRDPELSEISDECGFSREEVVESLDAVRDPISIYEPAYQDDGSTLLLDTIINTDENTAVHEKLILKELLAKLEPRERQIILLRFFRDKTQSEIARKVGVSQVQVSRIITRVLKKMQQYASE